MSILVMSISVMEAESPTDSRAGPQQLIWLACPGNPVATSLVMELQAGCHTPAARLWAPGNPVWVLCKSSPSPPPYFTRRGFSLSLALEIWLDYLASEVPDPAQSWGNAILELYIVAGNLTGVLTHAFRRHFTIFPVRDDRFMEV